MGHISFWSLRQIGWGGMDWLHLIYDGDHWWTHATIINRRFHKILRNSSVVERLSASQEGLGFMDLVVP
jgi:hypothetical protein